MGLTYNPALRPFMTRKADGDDSKNWDHAAGLLGTLN
jgi:hypothetical protein